LFEEVDEEELLDELELVVLEVEEEEMLRFLLEAGELVQLLEADESEGLASVSDSLVVSRLKISAVVERLSMRLWECWAVELVREALKRSVLEICYLREHRRGEG